MASRVFCLVMRFTFLTRHDSHDRQTLILYNYGDSTRLPISHPDHSLGPGLGLPSSDTDTDTDNDHHDKDDCNHHKHHHDKDDRAGGDNHTDVISKGQVPWTPKPKQVLLSVSSVTLLPLQLPLVGVGQEGREKR